jgi:hypothetical protein
MITDVFDDLREWKRVLEQLEHSTDTRQFGERHNGLAQLLEYRFNWRIRERAVKRISLLPAPEDRTLSLLLEIAVDQYTDISPRTLAADCLCGLIHARQKRERWGVELRKTAIERLIAASNPHHPPHFQRAFKLVIDCASEQEPLQL